MRRRELLGFMGAVLATPLSARGRAKRIPVVGTLAKHELGTGPLQQGLTDTGFVPYEDVAFVDRSAGDRYDELPKLAADLVRRKVDVIAAFSLAAALAARRATDTIPIVSWADGDPVAAGLAASLAHPGGNVTGVLTLEAELMPKRFELLMELVPNAKVFALLVNPKALFTPAVIRRAQDVARAKGVQLRILPASTDDEIRAAFATLGSRRADGLIFEGDLVLLARAMDSDFVEQVAHAHLPAMYNWGGIASIGGLITYGVNREAVKHQMGLSTGRILKGAKPAELPFVRAKKIELLVNQKTAKALGLTIPPPLLAQADKVIT